MGAALLLAAVVAAAPAQTGQLASPDIDELSGLAVSRADPAILWGHNDSGARPILYRIGLRGEDLGSLWIPDAGANDWEDIASFQSPEGPALLIADTGDNFDFAASVTLYAVRDPGRGGDADPLWRLDFRYPDGPHDCEAVAVDEKAGEILLISKRDTPPRIYSLPLPKRSPKQVVTAKYLGTLPGLRKATASDPRRHGRRSRYLQVPTAFDISADGRTGVVLTLLDAYLYRRRGNEPWSATLLRGAPQVIEIPDFRQSEAAGLSADGRTLYVGSEGFPAPFARIPLPLPLPHRGRD